MSQEQHSLPSSLDWYYDLLDNIAARRGCTDLTLSNNGNLDVRVFGVWDRVQVDQVREHWDEIVGLVKPAHGRPYDPRSFTTTFVSKTRRYRANYSLNVRGSALSLRSLPNRVQSPEDLQIPPGLVDYFCKCKGGLFLVGGRTGMGKSTTVASMVERRAKLIGGKFVTIENPIEYYHQDTAHGFFFPREVGRDVENYTQGIKDAMHQNPDTIIIQEILDRDSGDAALAAALTGHFVVATLHAYTASTLPQRFLAMLGSDPDMQSNWSDALASCLQAAVVQELLPGTQGLLPIHEILLCQDKDRKPITSVQRMLRTGNWTGLRQEIEGGHRYGMRTFKEAKFKAEQDGLLELGIKID